MLLEDIYTNSAFLSDEDTTEEQTVLMANQCFSYVNSHVGTNLPFFKETNYDEELYDAVTPSWVFRLVEPYMTWSIVTNDGADNTLIQFHYQRFLDALNDFANKGIDDIKTEDGEGNPTGYEGDAKRSAKIVHSDTYVNPWFSRWY